MLSTPVLQHPKISLQIPVRKDCQAENHTSSIHSIVNPAELFDSFQYKLLNLVGASDIRLDDQDFGLAFADCFDDQLPRLFEAVGVAIRQYDFGAAFASERDGCCLADAWCV